MASIFSSDKIRVRCWEPDYHEISPRCDHDVWGGKKYSSDILFSVFRVHVVCVWPNTESRILMQRWKPSAKVPDTSFSTDCVHVSLSAEAWWLYGRALCVHLHVRMRRCGPRGGHWRHVEPGPHLPHPCSFWHPPPCPLRHTAASHHKPNRLNPSASTCCAN